MPGLPFFDSDAPRATEAPAVALTIGSGGEGSGFGGIVDAAADLLGGGVGEGAWTDHLVELSLHLGFAPRVDVVELVIAQTDGAPEAAIGDAAQISIGPSGDLSAIFSGHVVASEQRGDGLRRYRIGNGAHQLGQVRINQSVVDLSVQDAIGFAIGPLGIAVEADINASDGTLEQYAFDDSRTLWDHVSELGALRGCNLWFNADNVLQLADNLEQGDPVATFRYGDDLLEHQLWRRTAHSGTVTALGGARGDDGFTLRKQSAPNQATTGDGAPQRYYRHGALRSQDDLTTRAGAAATRGHRQARAGELLVAGNAGAGPGRVVELVNLPGGGDGRYLVTAARHRLDRLDGWRTWLSVASTDAEGPGAAGLSGGLF